jgi:hypothetical protein
MAKLPTFDPIEFLVDGKFGTAGVFSGVPVKISAERRARKDPQLGAQIAQFRAHLSSLSSDELTALVEAERERQSAEAMAKLELEERGRFFNQPSANADFDHWSRAAHWTLDEAIALSFGKAPERVNWERIKAYVQVSTFAFQFQRRRDLALRAVSWKQLFDPVLPGLFLAWAKRTDLAVPPELEAAVTARGVQIADWKTLYDELKVKFDEHHAEWVGISDRQSEHILELERQLQDVQIQQVPFSAAAPAPEKSLSTRERESLLKLVIGMAIGGYGYDPSAGRSDQPAAIANDLTRIGLSLDVDTVRKWLKEAREHLPSSKPNEDC